MKQGKRKKTFKAIIAWDSASSRIAAEQGINEAKNALQKKV